jgi:hypothetical protein
VHNDEFNSLCYSIDIIRVIKSRWMKWARHACMHRSDKKYTQHFGCDIPLGRHKHKWEDNMKTDLKFSGVRVRTRIGTRADSCEQGDEPSGSTKEVEFLEKMSDDWLLMRVFGVGS